MTKLAALLAVPAAMTVGVANMSFMVVDVQEKDGTHIVVPVPLSLVKMAMVAAPDEARHVELPAEAASHLEGALGMVDALADAPDFELVRVEQPDQQVTVSKKGDVLEVRVSGDEQVLVNLPLSMAREALRSGSTGTIHTADMVAALSDVSYTDLVDVKDGDGTHVKVWMW